MKSISLNHQSEMMTRIELNSSSYPPATEVSTTPVPNISSSATDALEIKLALPKSLRKLKVQMFIMGLVQFACIILLTLMAKHVFSNSPVNVANSSPGQQQQSINNSLELGNVLDRFIKLETEISGLKYNYSVLQNQISRCGNSSGVGSGSTGSEFSSEEFDLLKQSVAAIDESLENLNRIGGATKGELNRIRRNVTILEATIAQLDDWTRAGFASFSKNLTEISRPSMHSSSLNYIVKEIQTFNGTAFLKLNFYFGGCVVTTPDYGNYSWNSGDTLCVNWNLVYVFKNILIFREDLSFIMVILDKSWSLPLLVA
jgi:hypothetical protein